MHQAEWMNTDYCQLIFNLAVGITFMAVIKVEFSIQREWERNTLCKHLLTVHCYLIYGKLSLRGETYSCLGRGGSGLSIE